MTTLSSVLERFVRWDWVSHILLLGFGVMCWRVVDWYMALKDPTGGQTLLSLLFGTALPVLLSWYNQRRATLPEKAE